ncbi:rhodanese-like domain-containing protein [Chitinolyticbacter albus]|uniref:rhodanese-like domain-containing protein n=1 Tax=Chitinolyticbacter albus TaxID=2961951 RepID=UPI00210C01E4|nr:rhodanese-like domain-containing protein [Chitinolyticbacter albus]
MMHLWRCWLLMVLGVQHAMAFDLPEEVQRLPQVGAQCKQQAEVSPLQELSERGFAPDFSCALSVTNSLSQPPTAIWVDTRRTNEYAIYHIPNSVNLSPEGLSSKHYLKSKPLVLVGSGRQDVELYTLCRRLKQTGFNHIAVLQGGMLSWDIQGKVVAGKTPSSFESAQLQAGELYQASRFAENAVIVLPDGAALRDYLAQAVPAESALPSALVRLLKQRRKALPNLLLASVIVVSGALDESAWRALQLAVPEAPVLYYTGSVAAYSAFSRQQQAQWHARERGPKQPRCGT